MTPSHSGLRPADSLRHGGFRHAAEGLRDLSSREPADRPQCERRRRCRSQRGMTTHEEQNQCVLGVQLGLTVRSPARRRPVELQRPNSDSRLRRAMSLRIWSVIRRSATWMSQPRGLLGTPSRGHCSAAAINASCTASSLAAKSRKRRITAPSTCGARSRSRCSE